MSKYKNIRCERDGYKFDSKKEMRRYMELKLLQRAGEIDDLKLQVPYKLAVGGIVIGKYIADFTYTEGGKFVCEDVKGVKTAIYRRSKKHMLAQRLS